MAEEEKEMDAASEEDEGPRRRARRAAAGHVDDLEDFQPSESDESDDEDIGVNEEQLAREAEELRRENDLLSGAPEGHVAHPKSGLLYDCTKYELRSCAAGKEPCYWFKYCVCFKGFVGKVRCLLCPSSATHAVIGLGTKYDSGNLIRHFKTYHADRLHEYDDHKARQVNTGGGAQPGQMPALSSGRQHKITPHLAFDGIAKENCHRALAAWIVNDKRPFQVVESDHFRRFADRISSGRYAVPCRETVVNHVCGMDVNARQLVAAGLKQALPGTMTLTVDAWTSGANDPCIGVRMYYVSRQLEVASVLLTMEAFDPPHTAEATQVVVNSLLERWGLEGLVQRATTDNAATMVKAFEERLEMECLPCAAHWLQLTLSDCLFSETKAPASLRAFIAKCRALVGHFSHSAAATDKLLSMQGRSPLRPIQDVETRWNSTYQMLERLQQLKDAIIRYCMEADDLEGEHWDAVADRAFWQVIDELVAVLRPFYNTSNKWQGDADKGTPISVVYTQILQLRDRLETAESSKVGLGELVRRVASFHPGVIQLRQALLASVDERWGEGSVGGRLMPLYRAAALLDPRHKGHRLLHSEGLDQSKKHLLDFLKGVVPKMGSALRCSILEEEGARGPSGEVLGEAAAHGPAVTTSAMGYHHDDDDDDDEYYEPQPSKSREGAAEKQSAGAEQLTDKVLTDMVKAELELFWGKVYDDADFLVDRKSDSIGWWRGQASGGRMRNLAILAISILSIPATSACVERLFSAAKHQITDTRNALGKERVRQLMFVSQNWREELRQLSEEEVKEYKGRSKKREAARQRGIHEANKARRVAAADAGSGGGGGESEVTIVGILGPGVRQAGQQQSSRGSLDGYFRRATN